MGSCLGSQGLLVDYVSYGTHSHRDLQVFNLESAPSYHALPYIWTLYMEITETIADCLY
jgi:hypothetical protein